MHQPDYKSLYKELFHEVRSITGRLVGHAGELSKALEKSSDIPRAEFESQAVAELTFQLQNWLQLSELESGSAVYQACLKTPKSLHGVFFRAGKMMRASMREKRLRWLLKTDTKDKDTYAVRAFPILDTLPYLLLDNAIKYSVADSIINCMIGRIDNHVFVRITSRGPMLEEGEEDRVIESGYRGTNAQAACPHGAGRGLALVAMICRLHEATLDVKCESEGYSLGGVDFGRFCVTITF